MIRYPDRPTFSQRRGRGPRSTTLTYEKFREYLVAVVEDLFAQDFLQQAFGYYCVDAGKVPGVLGRQPDLYFIRRLGYAVIPIGAALPQMESDQAFDLIEVLHDIVSEGNQEAGTYHSYSQCGWHYLKFDKEAGQAHLRETLNPLLERLDPPLVLSMNGQLEELGPVVFRPLLDAPIPATSPEDAVRSRVNAAVAMYKRSRGGLNERKVAVRELADVLEFLRPQVKESMMSRDEGALFQVANGFAIRHHRRDQRGDYDTGIWLAWTFYVYLATIQAVTRVMDRETKTAEAQAQSVT